jgi:sugar lactone lactonase YvrE
VATASSLAYPQAVAVDREGNVYIVDNGPYIHKVNPTTGISIVVAGNGGYGFSGDGGLAIRAQLLNPTGIAVDNIGNLYISDYGNYRIRKVDTSGIINTIAGTGGTGYSGDGGLAMYATFGYIYGIAVDLAGNIFVADAGSECVRKIDVTTGKINTVAGNHYGQGTLFGGYSGDGGPATDAEFNYAKYIAVDKNGNLYISDLNNQRVRKVDSAGIINTIAGDGVPGYNGDGDKPASRELYAPKGVAVDANGNVYIAEKSNNRIRMMTQSDVAVKQVNANDGKVSIYPNPATDEITIRANSGVYSSVSIFNCIGQAMVIQEIKATQTKVNISELPCGVYYAKFIGKSGSCKTKFVKM